MKKPLIFLTLVLSAVANAQQTFSYTHRYAQESEPSVIVTIGKQGDISLWIKDANINGEENTWILEVDNGNDDDTDRCDIRTEFVVSASENNLSVQNAAKVHPDCRYGYDEESGEYRGYINVYTEALIRQDMRYDLISQWFSNHDLAAALGSDTVDENGRPADKNAYCRRYIAPQDPDVCDDPQVFPGI